MGRSHVCAHWRPAAALLDSPGLAGALGRRADRVARDPAPGRPQCQLVGPAAALGPAAGWRGHGERSRSQLHYKLGGTGNSLVLAVHVLVVNVLAVNSVSLS